MAFRFKMGLAFMGNVRPGIVKSVWNRPFDLALSL
jgi:hypothetical protein